jgi:hypothetical protein
MSDVPLPSDPHTRIALYADDTTVYSSSKSPALLCKHLQRYLDALAVWCRDWKVTINAMKSKAILISKKRVPLLVPLTFNGVKIPWCSQAKYLGVIIDNKFSWQPHVDYVVAKVKAATKALYPLLCGKSKLSLRNKRQLYLSYIQPIMTYASAAWTYDSTAIASALQVRQNKLLRVLTKAPWFVRNDALHRDLQLDL